VTSNTYAFENSYWTFVKDKATIVGAVRGRSTFAGNVEIEKGVAGSAETFKKLSQ
jgi:hypothetical protein